MFSLNRPPKLYVLILLLVFCSCKARKQNWELKAGSQENQSAPKAWPTQRSNAKAILSLKHLVFDTSSNARGGYGDVAATKLTVEELVFKHKYPGLITLIIDKKSKKILTKMWGKPIKQDTSFLLGAAQIKFSTAKKFPPAPPIDVIFQLASPSSRMRIKEKIQTLPTSKNLLVITHPVLGNTESSSQDWLTQSSRIYWQDTSFRMPLPGLGEKASGIYYDHFAATLKKSSRIPTSEALIQSLDNDPQRFLKDIMQNWHLRQADPLTPPTELALIYGIASFQQKTHFDSYLSSMAKELPSGKSFILISPLSFTQEHVQNKRLLNDIIFVEKPSDIPPRSSIGKIYIVNSNPLTHQQFNYFLRLSQIPPLVAGDNALSGAISMGIPFFLTRVSWNAQNVADLKTRLLALLPTLKAKPTPDQSAELTALIEQIYPDSDADLHLENALSFFRNPLTHALFKQLSLSMRSLGTTSLDALDAVYRRVVDNQRAVTVEDPMLRDDLLRVGVEMNDKRDVSVASQSLLNDPEKVRYLVDSKAQLPPAALSHMAKSDQPAIRRAAFELATLNPNLDFKTLKAAFLPIILDVLADPNFKIKEGLATILNGLPLTLQDLVLLANQLNPQMPDFQRKILIDIFVGQSANHPRIAECVARELSENWPGWLAKQTALLYFMDNNPEKLATLKPHLIALYQDQVIMERASQTSLGVHLITSIFDILSTSPAQANDIQILKIMYSELVATRLLKQKNGEGTATMYLKLFEQTKQSNIWPKLTTIRMTESIFTFLLRYNDEPKMQELIATWRKQNLKSSLILLLAQEKWEQMKLIPEKLKACQRLNQLFMRFSWK